MKDKFGRELQLGDLCIRVKTSSWGAPKFTVVQVIDFTKKKVKVGDRSFMDSTNLVLLSQDEISEGDTST